MRLDKLKKKKGSRSIRDVTTEIPTIKPCDKEPFISIKRGTGDYHKKKEEKKMNRNDLATRDH